MKNLFLVLILNLSGNFVFAGALDNNATTLEKALLVLDVCTSIQSSVYNGSNECAKSAKVALLTNSIGMNLVNGICGYAADEIFGYTYCLQNIEKYAGQGTSISGCPATPTWITQKAAERKRAECISARLSASIKN